MLIVFLSRVFLSNYYCFILLYLFVILFFFFFFILFLFFLFFFFFYSSRRRHTRFDCDWSSDVCSSDLLLEIAVVESDQRKRMVWLTEKGARKLEAALAIWRQAHARLARQVSVESVRRLAREVESL